MELQRQSPISSSDQLGRSSLVHFKRTVVVFCDGWWRHVDGLASSSQITFRGVGGFWTSWIAQELGVEGVRSWRSWEELGVGCHVKGSFKCGCM
jgi:hypothetical protein